MDAHKIEKVLQKQLLDGLLTRVFERLGTMGSTENFCLRWNDFESNVSGAFKDLRAEADFFDVTLSCTDSNGRSLQAHKVILSACSSFFKSLLRQQLVIFAISFFVCGDPARGQRKFARIYNFPPNFLYFALIIFYTHLFIES